MAQRRAVMPTARPAISVALPPSRLIAEHARLAARLGYRRVFVFDSPALYGDVWVALARIAESVPQIGVATGVAVSSLRHPVVTASAIATIEEMAPGRVSAYFGTGFTARLAMGQRGVRWADLATYVTQVRAAARGGRRGRRHPLPDASLAWFRAVPADRGPARSRAGRAEGVRRGQGTRRCRDPHRAARSRAAPLGRHRAPRPRHRAGFRRGPSQPASGRIRRRVICHRHPRALRMGAGRACAPEARRDPGPAMTTLSEMMSRRATQWFGGVLRG